MGTHDLPTRSHICIDRVLPRDQARPHLVTTVNGRAQAITPVHKQWANGTILTVAFLGGTSEQHDMVRTYAPRWSSYANLRFDFKASLPATIRVAFDPNDGSWSYIGTDCAEIPPASPTMNLGWMGQDVTLHEFGHAVSLAHEHQNPAGGIKWNEAAVIADLSGPPNYWDADTIRHNVLEKYTADQVFGTEFDPRSIMLYSFPASWTTDGFSAPWNQDISALDGAFTKKLYPQDVAPPTATPLRFVSAQRATIARGGMVEFSFQAPADGEYNLMTAGALDTVLAVYRGTTLLAQDDDSGGQRQPHVRARLTAGSYRVVVKCYSSADAGKVRVIAWG